MVPSLPPEDHVQWQRTPRAATTTPLDWSDLLDGLRDEFWLREEELKLLHEIDVQLLQSTWSVNELLAFVVRDIARILKCELAALLLRRGTRLEVANVSAKGSVGQLLSISKSIAGRCISEKTTICIKDLENDTRAEDYVPITGYDGPPMRSLITTPVILRDEPIGVLHAESAIVAAFKPVHERILEAVSAQVAIALQKAQTFDSAALFADVDAILFSNDDTQHVIKTALEQVISKLTDLEKIELSGAQVLFPRGKDYLEIVHSTNAEDVGLLVRVDKSVSGRAASERQTIVLGDVSEAEDYRCILGDSMKSEIAVPIMFGADSYVTGVLNVESEQQDAFSGFNRVALEGFADKVKTLLAFAKLRTDVSDSLEIRQANDLMVAIGDQAAHIVHRVKNLAGALHYDLESLQGQLRRGKLAAGPGLERKLENMLAEVDEMLRLPQWLSGFLSTESSATDINSCVESVLKESDLPANILVEKRLGEDIPRLPLFAFDIVVQNLIQNSVDAMPAGGHLTIITFQHLPEDVPIGYAQLVVQDTGTGISDEALSRMFELNFTTKERRGNGLGFGMWWVRNFVRRVGGDIWAANRDSGGAEITVQIPIHEEVNSPSKHEGVAL